MIAADCEYSRYNRAADARWKTTKPRLIKRESGSPVAIDVAAAVTQPAVTQDPSPPLSHSPIHAYALAIDRAARRARVRPQIKY